MCTVSAEVGVVFVAPAIIGIGLVAGAGYLAARGVGALAGAAGDRLAERQSRSWSVADRIARVVAEHSLLHDQVERGRAQFGDRITVAPRLGEVPKFGADLGAAEQWAARADAMIAEADARFRAQMTAARTGWVLDAVQAAISRLPGPAPVSGGSAKPKEAPSAHVADSLQRVLSRLDGGVPPKLAAVLQNRAADALKARTETAQLQLLDDLRYTVEQANEQTRRRRATLKELTARLAGYAGPAADEARAAISAAGGEPDPDLPALTSAVDAAVAATLAPMVRDYTRQALRESLEEIGCTVEEGFDVALGREGLAHLQRAGWDDLAVRVRAREDENSFYFNMVAPAGEVQADVAEVERQWCSAVDQLLPVLNEHGLQVVTTHRSEKGDPHVQSVDPVRFPFEQHRRDQRRLEERRLRERELPR